MLDSDRAYVVTSASGTLATITWYPPPTVSMPSTRPAVDEDLIDFLVIVKPPQALEAFLDAVFFDVQPLRQVRHAQMNFAELPCPARLFLVAVHSLVSASHRFAVRNLGWVRQHVD